MQTGAVKRGKAPKCAFNRSKYSNPNNRSGCRNWGRWLYSSVRPSESRSGRTGKPFGVGPVACSAL